MSHPPEIKKQYGMVTAVGTKLGELARTDEALVPALRGAPDAAAFRALVRERAEGRVPATLLDTFLNDVVRDDDWQIWRSRLLLQVKMVRDGGKPAAGHEGGKGVGKP